MLEGVDDVPWASLEHAYGSAADVPGLLRGLLDPDPKVRSRVIHALYGNVIHQGTRYPATPFVIPFLIEMCASPAVFNRADILRLWGFLITGQFSTRQRPIWGDGDRVYWLGQPTPAADDFAAPLHGVYRASLAGHDMLCELLAESDQTIRAYAAWVLACLPTKGDISVPKLEAQARVEPSGYVRAAIAFALGELGSVGVLRHMAAEDPFAGARCMAACELARIEPREPLVNPLITLIREPVAGYERIPGAGGKSTGDAAFAISFLPAGVQKLAVPAMCDRLEHARSFDTVPLVCSLLAAAFSKRDDPPTSLTDLQRQILARLVETGEPWRIGSLHRTLKAYGLPTEREDCANIIGVKIKSDPALDELRRALSLANIGHLGKARNGILAAIRLDPNVFERVPGPEECWLLCAKAFADSDPERAIEAFRHAISINSEVENDVDPGWRLADLIREAKRES